MEKQNLANYVKKQKPLKVISIIFYVLIAILILANVVIVSLAYFTDQKSSNASIITTGSVEVKANFINDAGTATTTKINENDEKIIDGYTKDKRLAIEVTGKNSCYLRITVSFKVANEQKDSLMNYSITSASSQVMSYGSLPFSSKWIKATGTNTYYYTNALSAASKNYIPLSFSINGLVNEDQNKNCSIIVTVDTCQSLSVDFTGATESNVASKWVS